MELRSSSQKHEVIGGGIQGFKKRIESKLSLFIFFVVAGALILIGPVLPAGLMSLVLEMMILSIFAMGYDICLGYTDQCSLGHSLFFGVGAS